MPRGKKTPPPKKNDVYPDLDLSSGEDETDNSQSPRSQAWSPPWHPDKYTEREDFDSSHLLGDISYASTNIPSGDDSTMSANLLSNTSTSSAGSPDAKGCKQRDSPSTNTRSQRGRTGSNKLIDSPDHRPSLHSDQGYGGPYSPNHLTGQRDPGVSGAKMEHSPRFRVGGTKLDHTPRVPATQPHVTRPIKANYEQSSSHPSFDITTTVFIIFCVVLLGFLLYSQFSTESVEDPVEPVPQEEIPIRDQMVQNFTSSLHAIKAVFPSQSKRLWATLAAATKAVLRTEDPSQPGIILIAGSTSAKATIACMEAKLSAAVTEAYEIADRSSGPVKLLIGHEQAAMIPTDLKLKIDDEFKAGLGHGSRVAVLQNLHMVPGKAAMMFHAYCDNESAPYKDAIIIFTFELDLQETDLADMSEYERSRAVEAQLKSKWESEIGTDNTMALLSRIANNIAIVGVETNQALKEAQCT